MAISECSDFFDFGASRERIAEFARKPLETASELLDGLKLSGFPAWVAWLAIHIFFLVGFRNRVLVLFQWAYSYVTFRRGARLITGAPPPRLR